tara:strand:+ start:634 stop:1056 length:423 start_codon:yes stop_codon:yes gene_type:complete
VPASARRLEQFAFNVNVGHDEKAILPTFQQAKLDFSGILQGPAQCSPGSDCGTQILVLFRREGKSGKAPNSDWNVSTKQRMDSTKVRQEGFSIDDVSDVSTGQKLEASWKVNALIACVMRLLHAIPATCGQEQRQEEETD